MKNYLVRFNKSRGQPGRGSLDHVWRIFEDDVEYLAVDVKIDVPSWSQKSSSEDWNIACKGYMQIDEQTGVVTISAEEPEIIDVKPKRTCDGCTACCQGYLSGMAHGNNFQPGKPCFFISEKSCSIYADRPDEPCKSFKCEWLAHDYLPMWMRPDLSKVIVVRRERDNKEWIEVKEAGQKIDSAVLSWMVLWAVNNNKNLHYQVDGGWNYLENLGN